jgi:hypothetical protein
LPRFNVLAGGPGSLALAFRRCKLLEGTVRMSNTVQYDRRPDLKPLSMSNGLTSAFISVLALSASRLARTDHEKELAAWIGSRDQGIFGLGVVGFDLGDIPWSPDAFDQDRAFLLAVIAGAKARAGWDRLGYQLREDWIMASLDQFRELVEAFAVKDILGSEKRSWPWGKPEALSVCEKHGVYQHIAGCVVCND